MSFDKHGHSFPGQADTEFILASVKEQEIQFERLTRELEEEHNTVANQLEKCRIKSNVELNNIDEEQQVEVSDTESKRGSTHEQEQRELQPQKASASQTHLHKPDASTQPGPHQRTSSAKMSRPQTCPIESQEHRETTYSPLDQVHHHPTVAHPRPYYASPQSRSWVPDPPYPTYFSPPPVYQPSFHYYAQQQPTYTNGQIHHAMRSRNSSFENSHPPAYQNHIAHHQPLMHSHQYHHYMQHPHHQMLHQPPSNYHPHHMNYTHSVYYGAQSTAQTHMVHRVPPPSPKSKPPPPPPRKSSFLQHQAHPDPSSNFRHSTTNYSPSHPPYESHRESQGSPVRKRRVTPDTFPSNHVHVQLNNGPPHTSYHYGNQPSPIHVESPPVRRSRTPIAPSSDPVEYRRRNQLSAFAASPRTVNPTHLHHVIYKENIDSSADRNPEIVEVIQMLRHPSYQVVSNAAAYIQHITFGDDNMKTVIRKRGVLPLLVNLLHHHVVDVQQNACGALRNMVYGKHNDEAKIMVRNCGGISSLSHVLRNTDDQEMKELITGVLWNLSSCEHLKMTITDSAMPVLASRVIICYVSLLEPNRMAKYYSDELGDSLTDLTVSDLTVDPHWSTLFTNATGCLRNVSSAGPEVRRKIRVYEGLVEALLLVVENVIGKNDVDSKGVENCMCILRNLSYRLALEVEAAHVPITRNMDAGNSSKEEDCWRRNRKKEKRRSKDVEVLLNSPPSRTASQSSIQGVELLWQPCVVRRYLALLAETCNFGTLEAATGALQNLSAGQWVWSANIRTAVRKEKGLPMLVEFLHMDNERIVTVMCSTLRNMALDERNRQLIGKHAIRDFVDLLPDFDSRSRDDNHDLVTLDSLPPLMSTQKAFLCEAVCGALRELIQSNAENATALYNVRAVPKLIEISRGNSYRYPHRVVKAAGRVLAVMWDYKHLRSAFKQQGWTQYHFNLAGVPSIASVGSQVSPFSSPPLSPDEPITYKEAHSTPAYSKVPMQVPSQHHGVHSSSSCIQPHLPYAPMATSYPKIDSPYHSPQPDANYVMMIKRENDNLPVDSWV